MALPSSFFAPSFRQQKFGLLFMALVGIIVFLASFSTLAEAVLSTASMNWRAHTGAHLTVEIPAVTDETNMSQSERVKQTLGILHAMPGLVSINQVSDKAVADLLKPWITQPELLKVLPIPALIDLERAPDSALSTDDIKQQIRAAAPDARVEDHAVWLSDMRSFVAGLTFLAAMMIVLTIATLILVVHLLCRAIMTAEQDGISLLHIMGAEDDDIARHFAQHASLLSLPPALAGFILAATGGSVLIYCTRHLVDFDSVPPLLWASLGLLIALAPFTAVLIAYVTARLAALRYLHAMP